MTIWLKQLSAFAPLWPPLKYILLLALAILAAEIFWPRHYNVPVPQKRESTRYWDLPTGSIIAYTCIEGKSPKKPNPIVYLHGGPGGCIGNNTIQRLAPLAEDGYDIYLYDQIGGGFSDRLSDISQYTVERHKSDLEAIVHQLNAQKVILIGQSWGAILATLFAADHPDQVEKIILTSPGPILPILPGQADVQAPDSLPFRPPYFTNAQGNEKSSNLRSRATSYLATAFGVKLCSDPEADAFETTVNQETNKSCVCDTAHLPPTLAGVGFYCSIMSTQSFREIADPRPKLRNLECPVLVMKGQCDNRKWREAKEYLDIFPQAHLAYIPNAGHFIGFEQPELYLRAIRGFLDSHHEGNKGH